MQVSPQLTLVRHGHLLHHQLKFLGPLRWLDELFVRRRIRSLLSTEADDVIVNFNYDYHFLSGVFPSAPIIHVVNDDFSGAAIRISEKIAAWLEEQTVRKSHHTLCVSYSLLSRAQQWTPDGSLFLPWARRTYAPPPDSPGRLETLYWGFINDRIDFRLVGALLSAGVRINFVGQITPSKEIDEMLHHTNATHFPAARLEDLPAVLARCSCTILPYDATQETNRAVTMSNRGFELLSFGLPLLYCDLPHLLDAPARVIYRCKEPSDFLAAIEDTRTHFADVQTEIRLFLEEHYGNQRYEQFMRVVSSAKSLSGG
jgi:hypothetical protein